MKKFLSLVLALVMTMSLVTVSAGAKDFTDSDKIQYTEAVDVMSAVKVIDGYADGSFNPTATLTRGAAAKIICNLILGPTTASALVADAAPYSDVPTNHTFAGYIAYCQKEGIISGYADGTFKPANSLTGYAFMKMLLGALGYDAEVEGYSSPNWSINVAKRALNIGLDDGLVGNFNGVKAVNREEACLYALNTLTADMVEYDAKTTVSTNGTTVVIAGSKAKEMVNNGTSDGKIFGKDGVMQFAEKYFDNLTVKTGSDEFERPANVWKLKAEEIGTYSNTPDLTYTKKVAAGDIYKDLNLGSTVAAKNVTVYVNGVEATAAEIDIKKGSDDKIGKAVGTNGNGVLTEVFYDDDADTITITQIVTYIGEIAKTVKATDKKDAYVVITGKLAENNSFATIPESVTGTKAGALEFETDEKFADETYVLYTYSFKEKEVQSVVAAEKVEGYVSKTINSAIDLDQNNGMTISGTEYKMSLATAGEKLGNVSVKNDYTVYLDEYGYIIYVEEIQEIGNYALVLATASKGSFIGNKAQILLTDGTVKFVDTDENYHSGTKAIADNTIVTFRENSDKTYTLRKVNTTLSNTNDKQFSMTNDLAGITVETGKTVFANSASQFVVSDKKDYTTPYSDIDDWTAYTGIKNAPTVKSEYGTTPSYANVDVYYYCKSGSMVTVMFIIPSVNATVIDGSKTTLYLSQKSRSDLIHDEDGDYFIYNAVVDGKIETVKVDVDAKCGATAAAALDGLYSDYTVSSKGYITGLTKYTSYTGTSAKTAVDGVSGIDKTSKEYTVTIGGTIITCADDMKVFFVDKDGKISESSYAAIYPDTNDKAYAVVDKYLVKTLVIFEKEDTAPTTGSFDPADPKTAGIVGTTVVIPEIDGVKVDNAANALAKNGYTVTGLFGGTYWAVKDGTTYFFTESNPEYYTLTVNGTVVEYMLKGTASKFTEKAFAAKYGTDGTAYKFVKGGATYFFGYNAASTSAMTDGTAAVAITTGYVKVTDSTSATTISGVETATAGGQKYAKVNNAVTVEYTVAANTSVTLNYTVGGVAKTPITKSTTAAGKVTFTVSGDKDIVLTSAPTATTYGITYSTVAPKNGVTMTLTGPATAVDGSTVTVKAKLTGKATGGDAVFALSGYGIDTTYTTAFTGVSKTAAGTLKVANGTDLGAAGLEVTFTFTMPASAATITVA